MTKYASQLKDFEDLLATEGKQSFHAVARSRSKIKQGGGPSDLRPVIYSGDVIATTSIEKNGGTFFHK